METIKNVIWGQNQNEQQQQQDNDSYSPENNGTANTPSHKREPMNGVTGNTAKGEPYDAGNMTPQTEMKSFKQNEDANTPTTESKTQQRNPLSNESNDKSVDPKDFEIDPKDLVIEGSGPRPIEEVARDNGGCMPVHPTPMTRGISTASSVSSSSSSSSDSNAPSTTHHQQDQDKHAETGSTTSHDQHDETSSLYSGKDNKYVTQGGGDMLERSRVSVSSSTQNQPMNQDGTHPKTDDYISSGMASDGGNFDVSRPGAGKEAHRLMHQGALHSADAEDDDKKKHFGIHGSNKKKNTTTNALSKGMNGKTNTNNDTAAAKTSSHSSEDSSASSDGKEKQGLSTKLKEKLHIGNH